MPINHKHLQERFFSLFPRFKQREIAEFLYPGENAEKRQSQISRWKNGKEPIPWDVLEKVVDKGLIDWNSLLGVPGASAVDKRPPEAGASGGLLQDVDKTFIERILHIQKGVAELAESYLSANEEERRGIRDGVNQFAQYFADLPVSAEE